MFPVLSEDTCQKLIKKLCILPVFIPQDVINESKKKRLLF